MRQESGLHALLRGRTDVPVPAILAHDFGHAEIDRDYLLMERLPGTPISHLRGLAQDAFDNILRDVGRFLRQVHEITGDRYGYVGDHRPIEP
jgi:aminoglycoside phosphotransferase